MTLRYASIVLSLLFSASLAFGQQDLAVQAIIDNQDESSTKVALPDPSSNEALMPGSSDLGGRDEFLALTQQQESDIVDRAYPLMAAKWPFNKVFVCWEEMDEAFFEARSEVRAAVLESWESQSGLQFLGWGKCKSNSVGIRIAVQDTGPHVKQLGKFVDGIKNGMVLNFTYENWGSSCQDNLSYCNRVIAVHEFGHAIGFAHEQNRPDTPGECNMEQGSQGDNTSLTPWDKHSVMNYCNPVYSNDGVLSQFDIVAVQYIYGGN